VPTVDTFIGAGGASVGLVAITDTTILIADVNPELARALARGLSDGSLADVDGATRIELAALRSVRTHQHRHEVTLRHTAGGATHAVSVTFVDAMTRDLALAALQRRFGPAIRREETRYGLVRAIGVPLVWTVGIAAFSWVMVGAAHETSRGEHEVRRQAALIEAILTLIGPVGAAIVGILATAAALRWTYQRWRQPPLVVRLIRG
jgi:hypothetical protein